MAELVDALASGASVSNDVEVQVLLSAPIKVGRVRPIFIYSENPLQITYASEGLP